MLKDTYSLIDVSHVVEHGMVTYKGLPAPIICGYLRGGCLAVDHTESAMRAYECKGSRIAILPSLDDFHR